VLGEGETDEGIVARVAANLAELEGESRTAGLRLLAALEEVLKER
jgi:hypothetical protein